MEAAIPGQIFTSKSNPGEAVSAVTAIAKAEQEGQKIYHITPANQATTLPNIHLSQPVMDEIRASLAVGKEVITHTDNVSVPGWTGAGYIIIDPKTGIGAYKIGGGMNGSFYKKGGYLERYWNFVSTHVISLSPTLAGSLLFLGTIPKSWVGLAPLLGSKNPLTSVMRGFLGWELAEIYLMRAMVIPVGSLVGIYIGFYNATILTEGLIYAW